MDTAGAVGHRGVWLADKGVGQRFGPSVVYHPPSDPVNAPSAIKPTATVGENGNLPQGLLDSSQLPQPWYKQLFQWEANITVAGRNIEKGWVMPQALGVALCVIILGGVGTLYWRITDKQMEASRETQAVREMIIRIDQRLVDKGEHDQERFQELRQNIEGSKDHQAAVETVTNKEIALLKAKVR